MTTKRKYKCPYCDYREESEKLIRHVAKKHEDLIPEGYTPTRVVYNVRNKREHGSCMMCKKETGWDEATGRYKPFCSQKCHEAYIKRFENNMLRVRGKMRLLDEPEQQEKMLANRRISGKYKFKDGGVHTYTGSYERKALEFLDLVMNVDSKDIMTPGPTLEYEYNGKKHTWITDIFWISLNLIIEVKDGGDNPNKRTMTTYREKQVAKEKMITDKGTFHYLRLTNNNFEQLFNIVAEIKMNAMEDKDEAISRIYEAAEVSEVGPVGGMPPAHTSGGYLIDKGFNGINPIKDDDNYYADGDTITSKKKKDDTIEESVLANDIISDRVVRLNENGIPEIVDRSYLEGSDLTIYKFLGDKKKFLEVASSKKPINDFYEALTGKTRYTENQIDLDPLFERVNLRKKINKIGEDLATIRQEAAVRYNKALPYLPVMKIKDMESAEKLLAKYKTLNIAEDVDGYFMYNMITGRRTASVKNINQLVVEDTCLLENEKEIVDTDEALADREANDFKNTNSDAFIDDNVKTKAELDQEYDNYLSMTQDDRKRADDKSIELYGKDNVARYREKNAEFLKQDIKPKSTEVYTGIRNEVVHLPMKKDGKITQVKVRPAISVSKAVSIARQETYKLIKKYNLKRIDDPTSGILDRILGRRSDSTKLVQNTSINFVSRFDEDEEGICAIAIVEDNPKIPKIAKEVSDSIIKYQVETWKGKDIKGIYSSDMFLVKYTKLNDIKTENGKYGVAICLDYDPNRIGWNWKRNVYYNEASSDLSLLTDRKDFYLDVDKFESGEVRLLFITGMSGGGKTTLANKLAKKYNAVLINLDDMGHEDFTKDEYFKGKPKDLEVFKNWLNRSNLPKPANYNPNYIEELRLDYIKFCMDKYKNRKFIIEGVYIPAMYEIDKENGSEIFKEDNFALIILGTSVVKSMLRRIVRDNIDLIHWYNPLSFLSTYAHFAKEQNKIRKEFIKEDTYNFDAVNYTQDQVEDAKYWAANAMRVIITPQKTLEDLEFLWNQFQQQHRKLQRESDWKSQELFGMDNRTHYIYLKRQFLPKDIDDDPTETYDGTDDSIIEENMMVRNYNSFKNKDLNILLVTGDNKNSILARRIAHECNAEYIEDSKNLIDICENAMKNNRRIVVENSNVATLYNHNINWFDNTALIYVKDDKINESVNEKSYDQNKYDALINAYKGYLEYYKNENKKANDVLRSPIHTHTNKLLNGTFSNENDYEIYTDMPAFTVVDFDNFYGEFPGEISSWYNEYKKFSKSGIMTERFRKFNKERITKLSKLMNENNVNDKDILLLGWIPGIPFNEINRSKVDKNISKWIQENSKKEKSLQEKTIGIRFNKKGDLLWVKDPAEIDYASAWKESHELLKEYDKSKNYEGMKYELARMWFISNNILAQKGSSKYFKSKQMKDTRALAMNDFKKYLKVVIEHEKDFNFTQYYEESGFKQNTIRVPGATLDYSFDYLEKLLKIFV